jgi:hypothetical protein
LNRFEPANYTHDLKRPSERIYENPAHQSGNQVESQAGLPFEAAQKYMDRSSP